MKLSHGLAAAAAAFASFAPVAHAQTYYPPFPGDRVIIIETRPFHGSGVESGGPTWADRALADEVAIALHADRRLMRPGMTATVVANNGEVTLSGSADSFEQAQRAELRAKSVAGAAHVVGHVATTGG